MNPPELNQSRSARGPLRWVTAALLLAQLFPARGIAEDRPALAEERNEWHRCEKDADCITIESACPGWEAIHRRFARQRMAFIEQLRQSVTCGEDAVKRSRPVAICQSRVCTIPPADTDPSPKWYQCAKPSDCVLTDGTCPGQIIAVNRAYATYRRTYSLQRRRFANCPRAAAVPDLVPVCVKSSCETSTRGAGATVPAPRTGNAAPRASTP